MNPEDAYQRLLLSGAELLTARPFETVSAEDVIQDAGVDAPAFVRAFDSMHALGADILTREGHSMRAAQLEAKTGEPDPLARLPLAFKLVGENLASDVVVRAGIRIAGESHHCFPERRINPFRTWRGFVSATLEEAITAGQLPPDTDVEDGAWLITAAGLGSKDLLGFTGNWHEAPALLERSCRLALRALGTNIIDRETTI